MKSGICIKTYGCSANISESESMAGLLHEAGFRMTDNEKHADLIILNMCTVKGERSAKRELRKSVRNNPGKKFIVSGCITKELIDFIRKEFSNRKISLVNTYNIDCIVDAVKKTLKGEQAEHLRPRKTIKTGLPKSRFNDVISIIPIASGCTSYCAYCSVKLIKGHIYSYLFEAIFDEVKQSVNDGCKEIWLTSQDNSAFGIDRVKKCQLARLLRDIVKIDGDFLVRIGMMNPNNLLDVLDETVDAFMADKIFKFIHIPVQSGNQRILDAMKRDYTVDDFKRVIAAFRKKIPDVTLSTDVIVGFPGETNEEFMDTIRLIREIKPDILNISRFQARPGTPAAGMKQIHGRETKNRSRIMTREFKRIAEKVNKAWLGWQGEILIDEKGKDRTLIGRNYAYRPVIISGNKKLKLGDKVKVKIKKTTVYDLRADTID